MSGKASINPFPPKWIGLWRVKNQPYYYKERWAEADFGDRWRAIKARTAAAPARASGAAYREGHRE